MDPWTQKKIFYDFIIPTLSNSEQACVSYLIRHELSLTPNQDPTITHEVLLEQFINGTIAGQYVFDLGTGLKRDAVRDSLTKLVNKKLVNKTFFCPQCLIYQKDNKHCYRCSKKLLPAYSLHTLGVNDVRDYLNDYYEGKTTWNYDEATKQFYANPPLHETTTTLSTPQDYVTIKNQLREKLWFPLMVDEAVNQAEKTLKNKKMSDSRIINGFYKPIILLQEEFDQPTLKHALQETVKQGIAGQKKNNNWSRYARAVAINSSGKKQEKEKTITPSQVAEILIKCREFNLDNNEEKALSGIKFLVQRADEIRTHFSPVASLDATNNHLVEAFKKGLDDYQGVQRYTSPYNFLPNWEWGDKIPESWYNKDRGKKK